MPTVCRGASVVSQERGNVDMDRGVDMQWADTSDADAAVNGGRLTDEEIATAARLLNRLQPGYLPYPVFLAVSRLVTMSTMNVIALRLHDGRPEVFLIQRPEDDINWPGQWHLSGCVIRATDSPEPDFPTAYGRILQEELRGQCRPVGPLTLLGVHQYDVPRGRELTFDYYQEMELAGESLEHPDGRFFAVDGLPAETMAHQVGSILEAGAAFMRSKGLS